MLDRTFSNSKHMVQQSVANLSELSLLPEVTFRLRQIPAAYANYDHVKKVAQKYSETYARKLIWC